MKDKGQKLAVTVTALIAVFSIVTGIVSLSYQPGVTPLARYIPEAVRVAVSLTGAFTGFAMLLSTWGLTRKLRVAWYSALFLYPITALQGMAQSNILSIPLVVLSLAAIPILFANRSSFKRDMAFTQTQWAAFGALTFAVIYGVVGTYALSDHFTNISTPLDALYFTIVTMSTVGFGDVVASPNSQIARTFTLSLILVGTGSFAFAIGTLLTPAIESRLTSALGKMTERQLEALENHVIILGYGELTETVLDEMEGRADFVVITNNSEVLPNLRDRGVMVLNSDPKDEETLRKVRVESASSVITATNDDALDALSILTVNQLSDDVRVVASSSKSENVPKLRKAGADTVISPADIVGNLLIKAAIKGEDTNETVEELIGEETDAQDES